MKPHVGQLVIYGAWYFGEVAREAAELIGWEFLGFVDPDPPAGITTLKAVPLEAHVFVAIGDNSIRSAVSQTLKDNDRSLATIIHPNASVSPSAQIGAGSYIAELCAVRTNAIIAEFVVLQAGSVVSHDCAIAQAASFGPNSAVASKAFVGERTCVGVGAAIAPSIKIGEDCTVAAGAAVFKTAENGKTLIGNPARATATPRKPMEHSDWAVNCVW